MSGAYSNSNAPALPGAGRLWAIINCVVFGLAAGIVMWLSDPNATLVKDVPEYGSYYNLLVDGFRAGHLSLNREPPSRLAQLSDPYNPVFNSEIIGPVNDLSYYNGKLYVYFGVTPALLLYWPWVALTGHYLSDRSAVALFFAVGVAAIAGLLSDIRRRYFSETSHSIIIASILAVGLMTGLTLSGNVYEVAIACGFAFVLLALVALWRALHEPRRRVLWLALASLAYGLAVGARPTLLFGIVILLIPVVEEFRAAAGPFGRRLLLLAAATCPAILIGLALMTYNELRFGNPFEFGWHYQVNGGYDPTTAHQFSPGYFWFNFRIYFLQCLEWTSHFPFLRTAPLPPWPEGYDKGSGDAGGGILCRYPLAWLALAALLTWRGRPAQAVSAFSWFVVALSLLLITSLFTLCLFFAAGSRYELDFLPALLALAVIGFLGVERATAFSPGWRFLARGVFCLLASFSVAFSLLENIESHAETHYLCGNVFFNQHLFNNAMDEYQKALVLWPDCLDARDGLGNALLAQGRLDEAIVQYQKALELDPQSADAHERYGDALFNKGSLNEAMLQYKKAIEIKPDFAQAHENLGTCFAETGRLDDSIVQFQEALKLQPNLMAVYYSLGNVFRLKGMETEAVTNFEKAIELEPEFTPAQVSLADLRETSRDPAIRDVNQALTLMENANRTTAGKDPQVLRTLAAAYAETGRTSEAITTAKNALGIATTGSDAALVKKLEADIRLYQARSN